MEKLTCPYCSIEFDCKIKWNSANIQSHTIYCEKKNKIVKNCKLITGFFGKLVII